MEVLASITVIVIIAGIVFPAISAAKSKAQASGCAVALSSSSRSILLYSSDYNETLPPSEVGIIAQPDGITSRTITYRVLLQPYGGAPNCEDSLGLPQDVAHWAVPQCVNGSLQTGFDVDENGTFVISGESLTKVEDSASTVLGHECRPGLTALGMPDARKIPIRPGARDLVLWRGRQVRSRKFFGGSSYSYVDLHSKWKTPEQLDVELMPDGIGFKP
jgi:type II secretory pathway pseudopilin PulG